MECTLDDYGIGRSLYIDGGILSNIYDIPSGMYDIFEEIRKYIAGRAKKESLKPVEYSIIQADVRELTDLSAESVKKYMQLLVEYEYLQIVSGKRHGTRFSYRLREDEPIKGLDLESMIPTVEEMAKILEEIKKAKNS